MTGAYVSRNKGMPMIAATAHSAAITMKIHLMPIVSVIKPPAMGPTTGPMSGPSEKTAIADARSRSEKRSLTVPPPQAIGALPTNPATQRNDGEDVSRQEGAQGHT